MIERRAFESLGGADHGWLKAKHHFSFSEYHDPTRMGWGMLRVWNDDAIASQTGFPPHPHRDMEIITYIRAGAISHQDNQGNQGRTAAGDVQVMSAGTGIAHAEYNREGKETRLFQIWILPDEHGSPPSWGRRGFPRGDRAGRFVSLASGFAGDAGALPIRARARVLGATLAAGQRADYALAAQRYAYLVPARGAVLVNGERIEARDGAAIRDEENLVVEALEDAEVVLVDVAAMP